MSKDHVLRISEHTHSFKSLLVYALPYTLGYTLLPYLLTELNFMLGGFLLTGFIVIVLDIVVITVFRKRHHGGLEKVECSRIALLSMALTLLISMVGGVMFFSNMGVSSQQMGDNDIYWLIGIAGLVAFIINYAVVFYSLWLMQRFWRN